MLFHERQSRLVAKFDPEGSSFHPKWKFQCLVDTGHIDTGIQICPTLLTVLEINCKNRWKLRFMHNNRVVFFFFDANWKQGSRVPVLDACTFREECFLKIIWNLNYLVEKTYRIYLQQIW